MSLVQLYCTYSSKNKQVLLTSLFVMFFVSSQVMLKFTVHVHQSYYGSRLMISPDVVSLTLVTVTARLIISSDFTKCVLYNSAVKTRSIILGDFTRYGHYSPAVRYCVHLIKLCNEI